jgi:hypothetical protein
MKTMTAAARTAESACAFAAKPSTEPYVRRHEVLLAGWGGLIAALLAISAPADPSTVSVMTVQG